MGALVWTACYWLHLMSTVIWIGGITFILFIAIPSARQVLASEAGKLMTEISKRFTPWANYCILLLITTGITLLMLRLQSSKTSHWESAWNSAITAKLFLVLGMIAIHFYRGLVLAPKIGKTASAAEKTILQKQSINLVKVIFGLGSLVLLFSAITS